MQTLHLQRNKGSPVQCPQNIQACHQGFCKAFNELQAQAAHDISSSSSSSSSSSRGSASVNCLTLVFLLPAGHCKTECYAVGHVNGSLCTQKELGVAVLKQQGIHLSTKSISSCLMSPCCSCCCTRAFCSCCSSCCMSLCCSTAWFFSFVTSVFSFLLRSCRQTLTMCVRYGVKGWVGWTHDTDSRRSAFLPSVWYTVFGQEEESHCQRSSSAAQQGYYAACCQCSCIIEHASAQHMLY